MDSVFSSISKCEHKLNSTTTTVRQFPIIADAWEDAALNQDCDNVKEEVARTEHSSVIQTNFMRDLKEMKHKLKETLTEIKGDIVLGEGDNLEETSDKEEVLSVSEEKQGDLEHLMPDYGWREAHGFRGQESWELPLKIKHCDMEARPGNSSKLAHEYADTCAVLKEKIKLLAELLRSSKNCLLYTGAGISTSSGIGDYASRAGPSGADDKRPKIRSPYEAQPTFAHRAFVALHNSNLIHYWVQQNHDGLPQKAGLPQHAINEIHGAWYDPSNPVVSMSGNLRSDLFADLLAWEKKADLTIAVGTSMCGMNSDRVFTTVANKGRQSSTKKQYSNSIGGVIINRQQTQFDHLSCLRIFADIDDVTKLLMEELEMSDEKSAIVELMASSKIHDQFLKIDCDIGHTTTAEVYRIPYTKSGVRSNEYSLLDMREGKRVRLTGGPYENDEGIILGTNREGHWRIQFFHLVGKTRRPFESVLGSWWIKAAVDGTVSVIPIVTVIE